MAVRTNKRTWVTSKGETREAHLVYYRDQDGKQRFKQFKYLKEAQKFFRTVENHLEEGIYVDDKASITVTEAAKLWRTSHKMNSLEPTTADTYKQQVRLHIEPFLGSMLLTKLNVPTVARFEERLHNEGRSPAMVRKVMVTLGSLIAYAQSQGFVSRNVVRDRRGSGARQPRHKNRPRIGVEVPTFDEIRLLIQPAHLQGRFRPLILTAIYTGLRASELRGLRWQDVDLERRILHVRQRCDRLNQPGTTKSGRERTVPFGAYLANTLREWRLECPKGDLDLVFPKKNGQVETHSVIFKSGLAPAQRAADLMVTASRGGKPILKPKYGLHSLRHFYASYCINRREDGGLGLPPKVVQERLGHASVAFTLDRYTHLWPSVEDGDVLDAAEQALMAV